MTVVDALKNYLTREIRAALDSSSQSGGSGTEDSLRLSFCGPPTQLLDKLFGSLTESGVGFVLPTARGEVAVPVFLVDPNAIDPVEASVASRCTANYLVSVRNRGYRCFLVLHEVGAAINQSVTTAIKPLGFSHEVPDVDRWLREPVVSALLEEGLSLLLGTEPSVSIRQCVRHALVECWDIDQRYRDKRQCWHLVQRLFNFARGPLSGHEALLAVLGLPVGALNELGSSEHLETLRNVASLLESNGLTAGFEELENAAAGDTGLISSLQAFRNHLRATGVIEAGEFSKAPLQHYAPRCDEGGSVPAWWRQLSVDAWMRLLVTSPPPAGKLVVRIDPCLVPMPRGMPALTLHTVRITANINDLSEREQIAVSRASGQTKLQQLATLAAEPNETAIWEDTAPPEHERFLRYRLESPGYSVVTTKVIVLEKYTPGVVAVARNAKSATPFRLNRKAKDAENNTIERWECEVVVTGMGYHPLDLFVASTHVLSPMIRCHNTNAEESDPVDRPINQSDSSRWTCLIETDEESYFDFSARSAATGATSLFRVHVTAEEVDPTEVNSHFQRLVLENRAVAGGDFPRTRVEPRNCRASDLEELAIEDIYSFRPVILGPDYLDAWRNPDWGTGLPLISRYGLPVDPRPSLQEMTPPQAFLEARKVVLQHLGPDGSDELPSSAGMWPLFECVADAEFNGAVQQLVDAYLQWLEQDYDNAIWSDVFAVHGCQSGVNALESTPYAVLLTPLHPIRLAWQCHAQATLHQAVDRDVRCPAASTLTPALFPDCLSLACRTGAGSIVRKQFAAVASSSDYWGTLWAVEALGRLGRGEPDPVLSEELGLTVDGLSAGFSAAQVIRSLDEVHRLLPGRTTLRVNVCADTAGPGSLNEGIQSWCDSHVGPDADCWSTSGAFSLEIVDHRPLALQPEQAALASLTAHTDAAISWFDASRRNSGDTQDLSILAHLGTINHEFSIKGLRSAIDSSALTRWRVRKQVAGRATTFIAESRVAEKPSDLDRQSLAGALITCVDYVEAACRQWFDSYVFAPNMQLLASSVESAAYCAVSSSSIDAACFFGADQHAYLWDYELPSYSRRAGENSGYFLLAKHSEAMAEAIRNAVSSLGNSGSMTDADVASMLDEISRRGMPTLKRLTAGGATSLGEVGTLIALRMLQSDFQERPSRDGILPAILGSDTLNLIVPADPFAHQLDDVRSGLHLKSAERPDLLVLSLRYEASRAVRLKVTPMEVKARTGVMGLPDRKAALGQANAYVDLFTELQHASTKSDLWGVAYRGLLAALLDYGFRVYGQLSRFIQQDEWAMRHSAALHALGSQELDVAIDTRGRLIVIDGSNSSSMADIDEDQFKECIVLSHRDATGLILPDDNALLAGIRNHAGTWDLTPASARDDRSTEDQASGGALIADNRSEAAVEATAQTKPLVESDTSPAQVRHAAPTPSNTVAPEGSLTAPVVSPAAGIDPSGDEVVAPTGIRFGVGTTIHSFTTETLDFYPGATSLNHLNIGIVGDLGTGKTQLVQSLLYQLRHKPEHNRGHQPNILIFDYKKDYSKPEFVAATGATVVQPYQLPLNLFDCGEEGNSRSERLKRTKFFCDVLEKLYSGIGPRQREKIKQAVRAAYEAAMSSGRSAPTLNDVFDAYAAGNGNDVDSPYSIMSDLVDGEHFVASSDATVPFQTFLSGVVVIDLASIGQDNRTKNMLVVIFLNLFYEHMLKITKRPFLGSAPQTRYVDSMLLVDEADNIMRFEFEVLKSILLQGREFGVGVLLASQYLSHFRTTHENYAEPLLTWFVHKVPNLTVRDLEGIGMTNPSIETVNAVKGLNCHECLYKTAGIDGRFIRGTPFYELRARP